MGDRTESVFGSCLRGSASSLFVRHGIEAGLLIAVPIFTGDVRVTAEKVLDGVVLGMTPRGAVCLHAGLPVTVFIVADAFCGRASVGVCCGGIRQTLEGGFLFLGNLSLGGGLSFVGDGLEMGANLWLETGIKLQLICGEAKFCEHDIG